VPKKNMKYSDFLALHTLDTLPERQKECLILMLNGYSNNEMVASLNVTRSALTNSIVRVRKAFDVTNDRELLLKVIPPMVRAKHPLLKGE